MSKKATLIDNNGTEEINYELLSINPKQIRFLDIKGIPQRSFKLNEIYTISGSYKIGQTSAEKLIEIVDKDDKKELKDALKKLGVSPNEVQIGGKRKRKTRKSKRPRKSKKSKRKTNRKKI
jgi:hypothetical protein